MFSFRATCTPKIRVVFLILCLTINFESCDLSFIFVVFSIALKNANQCRWLATSNIHDYEDELCMFMLQYLFFYCITYFKLYFRFSIKNQIYQRLLRDIALIFSTKLTTTLESQKTGLLD